MHARHEIVQVGVADDLCRIATHDFIPYRDEVLGALALFFQQIQEPEHFVIYFSGHGNKQTGNWVFTDGEISLQDVNTLFLVSLPSNTFLAGTPSS